MEPKTRLQRVVELRKKYPEKSLAEVVKMTIPEFGPMKKANLRLPKQFPKVESKYLN